MTTLRLPAPTSPATHAVRTPPPAPARTVLVGARGHGTWHLRNLQRAVSDGTAELVGVCDSSPVDPESLSPFPGVQVDGNLERLLTGSRPDVVVVCTPIHTHADLALAAMRAGAHVLLEKPPAPSLVEYERIRTAATRLGRRCQIGFQDLGSTALDAVDTLVHEGTLGAVVGIAGACAWIRPRAYFTRAPWAGKRELDGRPVVDGALTNPFAHAVAAALRLGGIRTAQEVASVEVELFRANDIEADDTSCVRVVSGAGLPITVAASLCAAENHDPHVVVSGTRGRATLFYKRGELVVETGDACARATYDRVDLLDNLVDHIADPRVPLLSSVESSAGFMQVVEAIRRAPSPHVVPAPWARTVASEAGDHVVIDGIDDLVDRAARSGSLFSEIGAPWALGGSARGGSM